MEAYLHGVSTRKVDDLVRALGMPGVRGARGRAAYGGQHPGRVPRNVIMKN
jgi:hypothetical protein